MCALDGLNDSVCRVRVKGAGGFILWRDNEKKCKSEWLAGLRWSRIDMNIRGGVQGGRDINGDVGNGGCGGGRGSDGYRSGGAGGGGYDLKGENLLANTRRERTYGSSTLRVIVGAGLEEGKGGTS